MNEWVNYYDWADTGRYGVKLSWERMQFTPGTIGILSQVYTWVQREKEKQELVQRLLCVG